MTQQEFIDGYCARSDLSWDDMKKYLVALPCACGDERCAGWAMVSNRPDSIKTHNDLYAPSTITKDSNEQH